jgi:hypothetical protein
MVERPNAAIFSPRRTGAGNRCFMLLRSRMDNRRHGIGNPRRGQVPVGTALMGVKLTLEKHDISLKNIPSLPRGEISNKRRAPSYRSASFLSCFTMSVFSQG